MDRNTILIAEDDDILRRNTQLRLQEAGYRVITAPSGEQALHLAKKETPTLMITDLRMPGLFGIEVLKKITALSPETTVVVMTAFATVEAAVEAMKAGAYDYVTKPVDYDLLLRTVKRAMERHALVEEVGTLRRKLDRHYGFESIIGHSQVLLRVLDLASRVASRDSTVLIRGETGTGKELLARAIHQNSLRKDKAFVTINCGAIPKDLLESELFGHTKGAFTGAYAPKIGKIQAADGGTLFLDEIGELPVELQVKLLRLIQQGEMEKVGATEPVTVDVRIIAATHRNLQNLIEDGTFREDLFYRLAVVPLELPPLRERAEDIPELVKAIFLKVKKKRGLPDLKLPSNIVPYFSGYRWPGNIRELENMIERLTVLAASGEISVKDLPDYLRRKNITEEVLNFDLPPQGIGLEAIEKEVIVKALRKFDWNQTKAAAFLNVSRRTLIYRMEKYGLHKDGTPSLAESSEAPPLFAACVSNGSGDPLQTKPN
jgi:DNA-binding NtrC family response regulator